MRILFTNRQLVHRAGTELVTRELALAMLRRGHTPICFSPQLGEAARELRDLSVPVTDDLASLGAPPDIIHGQHHLPSFEALLFFPDTPGIFVCHHWVHFAEEPHRHPRWRRFVAVDDTCRDRLECDAGVPPELVHLHLNRVDLQKFASRSPDNPLPARPRRALLFSNYVRRRSECVRFFERVCRAHDLELDVLGLTYGKITAHPERELPRYDLVFAIDRSAMEALACGCAVILGGTRGVGPLVGSTNYQSLRRVNFGMRALGPFSEAAFAEQIALYNAQDALTVSQRWRSEGGLEPVADAYEALYREVVDEWATLPREQKWREQESRAVAAYLRSLASRVREEPPLHQLPGVWRLRAIATWKAWRARKSG